jgi:hypothetical protein
MEIELPNIEVNKFYCKNMQYSPSAKNLCKERYTIHKRHALIYTDLCS